MKRRRLGITKPRPKNINASSLCARIWRRFTQILGSCTTNRRSPQRLPAISEKQSSSSPPSRRPTFFLGILAVDDRRHDEAVQYLRRAQALGAPEVEVNLYLGHAYYGQSSYELAARHFEKAAERRTDAYLDVLYHLSKSYSHLANKYFALLAEKFAESFLVHLARAHAFEIEKDWKKARIEYDEALKQNPGSDRLLMFAKYSVGAQRAAPAPARHSLYPKTTLYSASINKTKTSLGRSQGGGKLGGPGGH